MNNLMVLIGRLIHTQKRNQLTHLEITILLRKKNAWNGLKTQLTFLWTIFTFDDWWSEKFKNTLQNKKLTIKMNS